MNHLSQLGIYSIGVVAINKPLDSRDIEVVPIEALTMINGEATDNADSLKSNAMNASGEAFTVEMQCTNSIKATWLPFGSSNRVTAPDVRRGEMVAIYRYGDTDQFWWMTLKDDLHLRKLETVIYAFSGTRDEKAKPDSTNTYFFEVSTHKKLVHFHTSQADGEPFAYDIQINTGEGFIHFQDDIGNVIRMDSKSRRLTFINADKTTVDLDKFSLFCHAKERIEFKSKVIHAESEQNIMDAKVVTQKATESSSLEAPDHTVVATTTHIGNTAHMGNFALTGSMVTFKKDGAGGDCTFAGDATFEGDQTIAGNLNVAETMTANLVVSVEPVVAPNAHTH